MKFIKIALALIITSSLGYLGYKWDKKRKLDNYFIEQFALDRRIQLSENEKGHGQLFEDILKQMKEEGYNPQEIYQIQVKAFDKGTLAAQNQNPESKIG
jgi:hypothetical protein